MLIDTKQVAFLSREFDLVKYEMINGVEQDQILNENAVPLHYYELENGSILHALNHYIIIKVVNPKGRVTYEQFHKRTTVTRVKAELFITFVINLSQAYPCLFLVVSTQSWMLQGKSLFTSYFRQTRPFTLLRTDPLSSRGQFITTTLCMVKSTSVIKE